VTGEQSWLDAAHPHDEEHAAAQLAGLERLLAPAPRRVLDLGCGTGRVLVPLAAAGHDVVGVDRDSDVIDRCRAGVEAAGADAALTVADFTTNLPAGPFDAVLCLGNTFMTIADVEVAARLLARVRDALAPGGCFIIDDCPRDFWPELTEGNWLSGVSPDGDAQLVWDPGDALFAIRRGADVDTGSWTPRPGEPVFRLWSDGALRLLARAAGLSAPERDAAPLLVMRPGDA